MFTKAREANQYTISAVRSEKLLFGHGYWEFGSSGTRLHNLTSHGDIVLSAVYGSTLSFSQWERMFERYASELEGVHVANLQRAIAARARCLVLFGGGGFQAQAKHFYQAHHADPKQWCVHRVCTDHEPNIH